MFDQKNSMFVSNSEADAKYALGLLLSGVAKPFIDILSPKDYGPGSMKQIPVLGLARRKTDHNDVVNRLIDISKEDWNLSEESWDFVTHPLFLEMLEHSLRRNYENMISKNKSIIQEAKNLEDLNASYFFSTYGESADSHKEVDDLNVTLRINPLYRYKKNGDTEPFSRYQSDCISEVVSYSIGCMMGRYSLDKHGLILASQGETVRDYLAHIPEPSFAPDENAIIPLTDQEWFVDDATNRFREFVRTAWGEEHLQENLDFVAESLCLHAIKPKKSEAALETIRRYLSTQFYKDHLRTYKKRPIYWLFSSGKQKAFECLVYLHRYNESTLAEMRTDYVIQLTEKLASYVETLEQKKDSSASAAEAKRIEKELSKLYKQQAELNAFDEKLRHYADQRISLDLDDGVKVNYGKFGDLLADVKVVSGKAP